MCTEPTANRSLAPGWQRPQVTFRLALLTLDVGSSAGLMSWPLWQLAQLATDSDPPRLASP